MDVCDNLAPGVSWPPQQTTICVLGPSIPSSIASGIRMFRDEFLGAREAGRVHAWLIPLSPLTTPSHRASTEGATVDITLDGREMTGRAGQFLIAAAEDAGVFIPAVLLPPAHEAGRACAGCASWR